MTDIINLNSIRSDNCDCNKPKQSSCGCNNHSVPQSYPINLNDLCFKVKNLFGELTSEWQRAEARSNLGVTDIIDLRQTKKGEGSGSTNVWTMTVSKGGSQKEYEFYVKNGDAGESATITVGDVYKLQFGDNPLVRNVGSASHAVLTFGIPAGEPGEDGKDGKDGLSAYEIYRKHTQDPLNEVEWLQSLKGKDGLPGQDGAQGPQGPSGKDGKNGEDYKITDVRLLKEKGIHQPIPNADDYVGQVYIWEILMNNGEMKQFWVPKPSADNSGTTPTIITPTITFLYKKVEFETRPSSEQLKNKQIELKQNAYGKTEEYLIDHEDWKTYADAVFKQGLEYIFMAVPSNNSAKWSIVQLTGRQGVDGTDGKDCDCSGNTPDPSQPDPSQPEGPTFGCYLELKLQDYYEETELNSETGNLIPYLSAKLVAFNNSGVTKRLQLLGKSLEVWYNPGNQNSVPLCAYSINIPTIELNLVNGADVTATGTLSIVKKTIELREYEISVEKNIDAIGFSENFSLVKVTGVDEEPLDDAFNVDINTKTITYLGFNEVQKYKLTLS